MSIKQSLEQRRSYYDINKNLPVSFEEVEQLVKDVTLLVPDAFNAQTSHVVLALGEKHDELWDSIYDVFEGQVPREKIDSFKAGAGTVLYFYDENIVKGLQEQFPLYAANFPVWANHASAMLQLSIWSALREKGIGASLQHYNPVIDAKMRELFNLPENLVLVAQMPFGGIGSEPEAKEKNPIETRVHVFK